MLGPVVFATQLLFRLTRISPFPAGLTRNRRREFSPVRGGTLWPSARALGDEMAFLLKKSREGRHKLFLRPYATPCGASFHGAPPPPHGLRRGPNDIGPDGPSWVLTSLCPSNSWS